MKKKLIHIGFFAFLALQSIYGQVSTSAFGFLSLPTSSHANALGGTNISLVSTDLSMVSNNPALLGPEMDNQISLNYMNYISDINWGGVMFSRAINDNGAWAIGAQYADYGKFQMTSSDNLFQGEFNVKDMLLTGSIGYNITSSIRGGATAKFIYSSYEAYSSAAMAVDLGLNYYNPDIDMSISMAAKNLGGQLKPFEDKRESLPFQLQLGFTQSLAHAPIRLSLTLIDLTNWDDYNVENSTQSDSESITKKDNFAKKLFRHALIGAEFVPNDNFYLAVGYSYKARTEFENGGAGFFTGFSAGTGIKIRMFDINASIARYHRSGTSFMLGVNMSLNEW